MTATLPNINDQASALAAHQVITELPKCAKCGWTILVTMRECIFCIHCGHRKPIAKDAK